MVINVFWFIHHATKTEHSNPNLKHSTMTKIKMLDLLKHRDVAFLRNSDPKISLTCVKDVNIYLSQGLVIFARAISSERVDLVPDRHCGMIDPPWPALQVHRPA